MNLCRNPTPLGKNDPFLKVTWIASGTQGMCLDLNNDFTIIPRPVDHTVKAAQAVADLRLDSGIGC